MHSKFAFNVFTWNWKHIWCTGVQNTKEMQLNIWLDRIDMHTMHLHNRFEMSGIEVEHCIRAFEEHITFHSIHFFLFFFFVAISFTSSSSAILLTKFSYHIVIIFSSSDNVHKQMYVMQRFRIHYFDRNWQTMAIW